MRKNIQTTIAAMLISALSASPAAAWGHANSFGGHSSGSWGGGGEHSNRWGGSTSAGGGDGFSHDNAWGGSTSGGWGQGVSHQNVYGGSSEARYGEGAEHTNMYGGTTAAGYGGVYHSDAYGGAYYHPPGAYYPYHPPTTVNYYGSSCYGCGGWSAAGAAAAGAVVGATVGAAVASDNTQAAYNAGVAAGSAQQPMFAMGAVYSTLPPGAKKAVVGGTTYYTVSGSWFVAAFGASGVTYTVVPAP